MIGNITKHEHGFTYSTAEAIPVAAITFGDPLRDSDWSRQVLCLQDGHYFLHVTGGMDTDYGNNGVIKVVDPSNEQLLAETFKSSPDVTLIMGD